MGAAECKGCSTSDPTSDTVKINPTLLAEGDGKAAVATADQGKDQSIENQRLQREAEQQQAREAAAEEERRRREAQAEEQERIERERAKENDRIAREEQERSMRELEAQERAAAEEAALRAQREEEERARRAEQARLSAELEEAKEKANTFLKARGFTKGIASAKKSCMKTSYPLHVAVEENSAEMVVALLKSGADKAAKNSSGLTPLALAQKLDKKKKGAYSAVLAALA